MPNAHLLRYCFLAIVLMTQYVSCTWQAPHAETKPGVVQIDVSASNAPPEVEPLVVMPVAPEDAVEINRATPFSTRANPPARPFSLTDTANSGRAVDCLAAAVFYEAAGEGKTGEQAVAQVVLNRLRHPAFPKTICGVVFQGAERRTGCQFTFACDGSLVRTPSPAGWTQARSVAQAALRGQVYGAVGYATHYHTNWVVPVWRTGLDKLVQVGTHIFYRWTGQWGTGAAFRGRYLGPEQRVAALAGISPAHAERLASDPEGGGGIGPATLVPKGIQASAAADGTFIIVLDQPASPDSYPAVARVVCATLKHCIVLGWTDAARKPQTTAMSMHQRDAMSFSYLRDEASKTEKTLWNCREFKDRDIRTCMKAPLLIDIERENASIKP